MDIPFEIYAPRNWNHIAQPNCQPHIACVNTPLQNVFNQSYKRGHVSSKNVTQSVMITLMIMCPDQKNDRKKFLRIFCDYTTCIQLFKKSFQTNCQSSCSCVLCFFWYRLCFECWTAQQFNSSSANASMSGIYFLNEKKNFFYNQEIVLTQVPQSERVRSQPGPII
jgi:hypothetical protein